MHGSVVRRNFLKGGAGLAALLAAGPALAAESAAEKARRLWKTGWVIDGNLVTPLDDTKPLDAETAAQVRASGLSAFKQTLGGATSNFAETEEEIAAVDKALSLNPDLFMKVASIADLDAARKAGRIGFIYSFESVEMLEGKVERIDHFAAKGVKVMQLSYNLPSPFASGVMSPQPSAGLTDLGRQAIGRMNRLGITLDLSHADERSTLAAVAATKRPPAITHAGCSAIYQHPRNKSDKALRAVAAAGGVVGLYELSYISAGPAQQSLDDYMAHLTHALKVCGEDHVGIGSDAILIAFDTGPENMAQWNASTEARRKAGVAAPGEGRPPYVEGLNRPDRSLAIAEELLKRGYRERAVEKVLGANFRRLLAETWTPAA